MFQGIGLIVLGLLFLVIALGKLPVSKNPEENAAYIARWKWMFLFCSLVVIVTGVMLLVQKL